MPCKLEKKAYSIPMATQNAVPNLTLSQNARLYKYVRLQNCWKYLRANSAKVSA
jgi:hypothetical protein